MKKNYNRYVLQLASVLIIFTAQISKSQCSLGYDAFSYGGPSVLTPTAGTTFVNYSSYSPGTYFQFPMISGGSYAISTCGAPINTQITGWNSSGTSVIFYNDDNGPLCSGTSASVDNYIPSFTGMALVQVSQFNCSLAGSSSINVSIRQNNNLVFTSSSGTMCPGQTRILTATPAPVSASFFPYGNLGTFSGTGVSGNIFTAPVVAVPTTYTITYTFGYVSQTQTITVNPTCAPAEALNFDGLNDYVNIGNSINTTLSASNKITVEAWVMPNTNSGFAAIVGNYSTPPFGTNMQYLLRRQGNIYTFWVNNGGGFSNVTSVATVTTGVWQHLAGTWDGVNLKIYVNGVLSGTAPYAGTNIISLTNENWIGGEFAGTGEIFNGSIDEVRIWNTTRSLCDIKTFKNCEIPATETGLLANYHFNQGFDRGINPTENTLIDASASALTGTLTNFALTGSTSNWVAPGGVVTGSITPAFNTTYTVTNVLCNGGSTGSATITANGGATPYTYLWSTGATTSVITGQTAGVKTVTVTDANGCTTSNTLTIIEPTALATATAVTNVLCFGGSTGSATITASGGSSPYSYLWSTAATTSVITSQTAGVKTVTVTDANGCTATNSVTITQPATALSTATAVTNVLCFGGSTGSATITASGGTTGYSYLWSTAATTSVITGQTAGVKTVTVTDANGCSASNTVTITEPASALSTATAVTNVLCFGGSTGSATITASGGTPGYTYLWSNGSTSSNATSLMAGAYTSTVTDANGCTAVNSVTLTQPSSSLSSSTSVSSVLCNGGSTGASTITASGGTPGYTYLWSNGSTTSVISSLLAGVYTGTVTDVNGCTSVNSSTITQPSVLTLTINPLSNSICAGNSISYTATASGGTGVISYSWSTGATTNIISVSPTANTTYTAYATDANGCVVNTINSVSVSTSPTLTVNSGAICSGNSFTIIPNGALTYTISGGSFVVSPSSTNSYTVVGTSSAGCVSSVGVISTVTVNANPTVNIGSDIEVGAGDNYQFNPTQTGAVTYSWIPNDYLNASNVINPITTPEADITYTLIVTSANGCIASDEVNVKVLAELIIANYMSPNGDGQNDTWKVNVPALIKNYSIEIIDSYGQSVFKKDSNYSNDFDGKRAGQDLPDGVYYYFIKDGGKIKYKGSITLTK